MSASHDPRRKAIYSVAQVREFDRRAIEDLGIAGFTLMQRAAEFAFAVCHERWPDARTLAIYCGAGNNAGDGYVLATLAAAAGLDVRLIAVTDPTALKGDARMAFLGVQKANMPVAAYADDAGNAARDADLIVDALLGTGLARDVDGDIARAIAAINASGAPVLALDVPTGLDADTGQVRGAAVMAQATATFVGRKAGLVLGEGPTYSGAVAFSDLKVPAEVVGDLVPELELIDPALAHLVLKRRLRTTHKGMNGRVLIVGGSIGMAGAARLAAEAALRVGAGLVHAAVAADSVETVMASRPEIMCRGVDSASDFDDWLESADVIVLGPGLGQSDWGTSLAVAALAAEKPMVVDADGLNYLARHAAERDSWVLTPHPGEAARLLGTTAAEVQQGRAAAVTALASRFGGVAVLKGACTLIADGAGPISVCGAGNPGMATGGMGDVLAGAMGGLIGQFGLQRQVVDCAVLVHAMAGDLAAADGERGLLASDLLLPLRRLVNPG